MSTERSAMDILITGPLLADQGGVASYYSAVLPYLREQDGFDIHYMEIGSSKGAGGILHPLADQIRFRRMLAGISPAVVHINPSLVLKSYIRDGLFIYQAKRLGYPVVVFFRGWDRNFESTVETAWLWFFKRTYLKADAFIVLASVFKDKLTRWGVTAPIQLGTTTVSSDLIRDFSITEKVEKLGTEPVIKVLFLARLEKEKGVMETMEAVTMLRAKGIPITLTVAGDGVCMDAVRTFADRHDESKRFLFVVGDVRGEKKRSLLASHHIYCFPTTYGEGMPNSVLEAMAFGMPVVTCATGGLRDFFDDGKMGNLVKQRTAVDVMNAIERLVNDRNTIIAMSSYNYRYATERFLAPGAADYLANVYRQVASTVKR
jgi:glycosyltransferase involved in cell wall biosynthesis